MTEINIINVIKDIKELLTFSNKVGFLFGAGTSCSLGIPAIKELTAKVEEKLCDNVKSSYSKIKLDLSSEKDNITIEDILNQIRQIRQLTLDNPNRAYIEITGQAAKELDLEICKQIYEIIHNAELSVDLSIVKKFFSWLNLNRSNYSKEIFTPNYDLLFEKALEGNVIPYFDGFVGAYEPFFYPESVERILCENDITKNWIRLWKLHGSLNWYRKKDTDGTSEKIVRLSNFFSDSNEIVIYPSREKYELSRKQPFISYFDKMKSYLNSSETVFVISGYSFVDQHINELIFNSLRQNQFLNVLVFVFTDDQVHSLEKYSEQYLNLYVLGPKMALINGKLYNWKIENDDNDPNITIFWDESKASCKLGNYIDLVEFLVSTSPLKVGKI